VSTFDELVATGPVVAPPVYDGFTALIAQRAGAVAVCVPADGTAAQLGLDPGAASVDELVDNVRYIATAVHIPVVADARGVADVVRAVRGFAGAGAAAVIVDDAAQAPAQGGLRIIDAADLAAVVTVPAGGWELSAAVVRDALTQLREGTAESSFVGLPFEEVTSLLGLGEVNELELRYATGDGAG
jgi:2-methylisocitrate lyase-like PEP mutase family enzyme